MSAFLINLRGFGFDFAYSSQKLERALTTASLCHQPSTSDQIFEMWRAKDCGFSWKIPTSESLEKTNFASSLISAHSGVHVMSVGMPFEIVSRNVVPLWAVRISRDILVTFSKSFVQSSSLIEGNSFAHHILCELPVSLCAWWIRMRISFWIASGSRETESFMCSRYPEVSLRSINRDRGCDQRWSVTTSNWLPSECRRTRLPAVVNTNAGTVTWELWIRRRRDAYWKWK